MKKLIILSGVSGIGKTTVKNYINENNLLTDFCSLDIDDLANVHDYVEDYSKFYEIGISKANEISGNKNILLITCMNPTDMKKIIIPENISEIKFIALTSLDNKIIDRLKSRDASRNCGSNEFITSQIEYNNWIVNHINLYDYCIDNSNSSIEETSNEIVNYIKSLDKEMGL